MKRALQVEEAEAGSPVAAVRKSKKQKKQVENGAGDVINAKSVKSTKVRCMDKTDKVKSVIVEEEEEEKPQDGDTKAAIVERKMYLLFIGNLPYGITEERLRAFLKMDEDLKGVRIPTEKDTGNPNRKASRGFAFVEFENSQSLEKCLLLHHSKFEGRRINVELTAGGGGNSSNRKKKIKKRNDSVNEWRVRRAEKRAQAAANARPTWMSGKD